MPSAVYQPKPWGGVPLAAIFRHLTKVTRVSRYAARAIITDMLEREPPPWLPPSWRLILTEDGGIALRTPDRDIPDDDVLVRYSRQSVDPASAGREPQPAAPPRAKTRRRRAVHNWKEARRIDREQSREHRSKHGDWPLKKERVSKVQDYFANQGKKVHPKTIEKKLPRYPTGGVQPRKKRKKGK
jgi:hypothetical protein